MTKEQHQQWVEDLKELHKLRTENKNLEAEIHNYRTQEQCNNCSASTIIALGDKGCKARCRIKELEALMQRAYDYIPKGNSLQKEFEKALKGE